MGQEKMPKCDVCKREFPESQLLRCYDCGNAYCPKCAEKDPTITELGVCPDCEEVFKASKEDYWGRGRGVAASFNLAICGLRLN